MHAMPRHGILFAAAMAVGLLLPAAARAQALDVLSLDGNWVRLGSNYDPNDQMRIEVRNGQAKLLRVPATVDRGFKVGQRLWVGIADDATLRVRANNGSYHPARMRVTGNELRLQVESENPGNEQVWTRGGPTIDGDWVRIAPGDATADGMRLAADQDRGIIRFLPAEASRRLRIGSRLWQEVGAGGAMQLLTPTGAYQPAILRLQGADTLWVEAKGIGEQQLWVRPGIAAAARRGFVATQPVPAVPPAAPAACLASSVPVPLDDTPAGWALDFPDARSMPALLNGLFDYRGAPGQSAAVTRIERAVFPDVGQAIARIWQQVSRRTPTFEEVDLTAAVLHARDHAHRLAGHRMIELATWGSGAAQRFGGVWIEDPAGTATLLSTNLTSAEYGAEFTQYRANGFRLVDLEISRGTGGELRYATLWVRSCAGDSWREARGMSRLDFLQQIADLGALGFRVVDIETYQTSAGQRYAALWDQVADRGWEVRVELAYDAFLNAHHRFTDQGLRLVEFESYQAAGGQRYAAAWAEHAPRYRLSVRTAIDDTLAAYRQRYQLPGLSAVIIRDGEVLYQHGIGMADVGKMKEAYSGTVYPIASITKTFAGLLATRLESRGVIDLTRPARDYVDSLPRNVTPTLEQLLSKTACTIHYNEGPEPTPQYYRWRLPAVRQIQGAYMLPNCMPGQKYHYSTHGYTLVGAALEAVTGKDIVELLDEEIIRPMALRSAQRIQLSNPTPPPTYHVAESYRWDTLSARSVVQAREDVSWKMLGGGLQMDALDLARYGWLTLSGGSVSADDRDNRLWRVLTTGLRLWSDSTRWAPPTALGWEVAAPNGRRFAEHGGTAGFGVGRSHLAVYRDDNLVVAVLTNQGAGPGTLAHPVQPLVHLLASLVLNAPTPTTP
jgi:CubicO group peptidase (beta-lactamase class C family)